MGEGESDCNSVFQWNIHGPSNDDDSIHSINGFGSNPISVI